MTTTGKVLVWIVTPHESSEYDEWWGPCETEEDHQAALDYALARMEDAWDQIEFPGTADAPKKSRASVTIEQRWMNRDELLEDTP
jgi:hypothetical protein